MTANDWVDRHVHEGVWFVREDTAPTGEAALREALATLRGAVIAYRSKRGYMDGDPTEQPLTNALIESGKALAATALQEQDDRLTDEDRRNLEAGYVAWLDTRRAASHVIQAWHRDLPDAPNLHRAIGELDAAMTVSQEQAGPEPPDYVGQGAARARNAWLDGYAAAGQAASQVPEAGRFTEPGLDVPTLTEAFETVMNTGPATTSRQEFIGRIAAEYARLRSQASRLQGRESQQPASGSEGGEA